MDDKQLVTLLNRVHSTVSSHFVEVTEAEELWSMPPDFYDGTQTLRDDCDGFCLACRVLLRQQNIPNRLVYCEIESQGHLVVEVNGWVLDNRQKIVVPNTLLSDYQWLRISGFEAGDAWHAILPVV
jgi:predicted transglutaminase-like cysteine proteinase